MAFLILFRIHHCILDSLYLWVLIFLFDSRSLGLQVSPETTMAIHCRR